VALQAYDLYEQERWSDRFALAFLQITHRRHAGCARRTRSAGGHGGHNGLRDSIAAVGADFWRLRLGIGHPGHKDQVLDYVLQRASAADEQHINEAILKSADLLPMLLFEGAEKAMNRLHTQDQ
jgi:peptidyl-tRNA hydrolase